MDVVRNDLDGVVETLREALGEQGSPRAFAPLAEAYRLQGKPEEAITAAREGLLAFPDHVGIRVVLARSLADTGDVEAARKAYQEVLSQDPENLEARAFLGETAGEEGEPRPIREPARPGPAIGGLSEELTHLAELFCPRVGAGDGVEAQDVANGIATLTLAEIYARQGLLERAAGVCRAIIDRDPENGEARAKLEEYTNDLASVG